MGDGHEWRVQTIPQEIADSKIFKFRITLKNGQKQNVDLWPDVDVDYDLIEQQLAVVPTQYMKWSALYSEMKQFVTVTERQIKVKRGLIVDFALKAARDRGTKLTEKQVASIVESDEELNELEENLALLQKHAGKLYHMCEAIKMKSENLRSLAGFKKQERNQE